MRALVVIFNFFILSTSSADQNEAYARYLRQIGALDLGIYSTENVGLNKFNEKLMSENSCFEQLVQKFYEEVTHVDLLNVDAYSTRENLLFNNLSVTTEAGPVQSGWLWSAANQFTRGDANMSMMLIGMCGHDDKFQYVKPTEKTIDNTCRMNQMIGKKITGDVISTYLIEKCDKDTIELFNLGTSACPAPESFMFRQGSLGPKTILPLSLREDIGQIQAPTKGWEQLPAKYYHTIASAYLTCQLKIEGVAKQRAMDLQLTAIRGYRHRRLCQENVHSKSINSIPVIEKFMTKNRLTYEQMLDRLEAGKDQKGFINEYNIYLNQETREQKVEKLKYFLAKFDAAELLKLSVYTNSFCLKFSKGATQSIKTVMDTSNPSHLTPERIKAAKDLIRTWYIDFVWSEEQHRIGVEFAYENCQKDEAHFANLNNRSCELLKAK